MRQMIKSILTTVILIIVSVFFIKLAAGYLGDFIGESMKNLYSGAKKITANISTDNNLKNNLNIDFRDFLPEKYKGLVK